jgi:membrane protein DedA with SNARE-associated domain
MAPLLQPASDFIGRHHEWAALVLGVATLLESLLLVGAFVPATALMLIAGGLMARGILDPLPVIVACVIGAVVGNAVSFSIGRRLGANALRHPLLAPHRRSVARTRLFCRRYGGASIYVGRFLGPLRAFVPVMVGMLRMRRRTFQVANLLSGIAWVLAMLAPGYLATKGLARPDLLGDPGVFIGIVAATALAIPMAFAIQRRIRRLGSDRDTVPSAPMRAP